MSRFHFGKTFLLLVVVLFVLLVGGTLPYFMFYIALFLFSIPLIHSFLSINSISGKVKLPETEVFTGEVVRIDYSIENNGKLSIPYLKIFSNISKQLTGDVTKESILSLEKREVYSKTEDIYLKRRGYYKIGDIDVTVKDIFGFYKLNKKIQSKASLLVYPEIITLSTFEVSSSQQSGELLIKDSSYLDRSRISSLRDYSEGDSIKSIHWRLSAKKDTPIVKDFEFRGDTSVNIIIDNYKVNFKDDLDRRMEDKVATAVMSIINYCLDNNINVDVATQDNDNITVTKGQNKSDLKSFLELMAKFEGNGAYNSKELIQRIDVPIIKGTSLIIVTSNLENGIASIGLDYRLRGLNPIFIVITDMKNKNGYIDLNIEKDLRKEGINVYILDYQSSIKETLEVLHG